MISNGRTGFAPYDAFMRTRLAASLDDYIETARDVREEGTS